MKNVFEYLFKRSYYITLVPEKDKDIKYHLVIRAYNALIAVRDAKIYAKENDGNCNWLFESIKRID